MIHLWLVFSMFVGIFTAQHYNECQTIDKNYIYIIPALLMGLIQASFAAGALYLIEWAAK